MMEQEIHITLRFNLATGSGMLNENTTYKDILIIQLEFRVFVAKKGDILQKHVDIL